MECNRKLLSLCSGFHTYQLDKVPGYLHQQGSTHPRDTGLLSGSRYQLGKSNPRDTVRRSGVEGDPHMFLPHRFRNDGRWSCEDLRWCGPCTPAGKAALQCFPEDNNLDSCREYESLIHSDRTSHLSKKRVALWQSIF